MEAPSVGAGVGAGADTDGSTTTSMTITTNSEDIIFPTPTTTTGGGRTSGPNRHHEAINSTRAEPEPYARLTAAPATTAPLLTENPAVAAAVQSARSAVSLSAVAAAGALVAVSTTTTTSKTPIRSGSSPAAAVAAAATTSSSLKRKAPGSVDVGGGSLFPGPSPWPVEGNRHGDDSDSEEDGGYGSAAAHSRQNSLVVRNNGNSFNHREEYLEPVNKREIGEGWKGGRRGGKGRPALGSRASWRPVSF